MREDERQREIPSWAERLVRFMDDGLRVPGTSLGVGLDAILGLLLPGAGDVLTAASALALLYVGVREGVPKSVLARMVLNAALDVALGAVPVLGDAFDVVWKANRKNLELIERHRRAPKTRGSLSDYAILTLAGVAFAGALLVPFVLVALFANWLSSLF